MADAKETIKKALRGISDPILKKDFVENDLVEISSLETGGYQITLYTAAAAMHAREELQEACRKRLDAFIDETPMEIDVEYRPDLLPRKKERKGVAPPQKLPGVKRLLAVASGKGGVGKSTTTTNLALALAASGQKVAILDADIYGPSIPMMLGNLDRPELNENGQIEPIAAQGIYFMSMGLLTDENTPVIWRGPMAHKMVQQFLRNVAWSELDYLIIDLPPGTGDIQLSLTQATPLDGAIIVTTPQDVALIDARKGLRMFQEVNVPVLGIIENMSYYTCPNCGHQDHIFGSDGGVREARKMGTQLLGRIPLTPAIVACSDTGRPIVVAEPDSKAAKIYSEVAASIHTLMNDKAAEETLATDQNAP